jgi:hypothetical protein
VQVRIAGELHTGAALSIYDYGSPYVLENEVLREQLRLIAEEMDARGASNGGGQSAQVRNSSHAAVSSPGDSRLHSNQARRSHSGGGAVGLNPTSWIHTCVPQTLSSCCLFGNMSASLQARILPPQCTFMSAGASLMSLALYQSSSQ